MSIRIFEKKESYVRLIDRTPKRASSSIHGMKLLMHMLKLGNSRKPMLFWL